VLYATFKKVFLAVRIDSMSTAMTMHLTQKLVIQLKVNAYYCRNASVQDKIRSV